MGRELYSLYEDDIVDFVLEVHDELPFLHCTVKKWNKSSYLHIIEVWVELTEKLKEQGIDFLFTWSPDEMSAKFARMFGFKTLLTDEAGQSLSFVRY